MSAQQSPSAGATQPPRAFSAAAGAALAIGLFLGAATLGGVSLRRSTVLRATWPAEADLSYLPSAGALRLLSLGHTELASDLVAARANIYFGGQLGAKAEPKHLSRYLQTAADLDPRFHRIYLSGAAMLIYNGAPLTAERVLEAIALLDRGRAVFPEDWELPFQLGFNKLFELPKLVDPNDPRIPAWRQEGVEAMREAAMGSDVPPWLPSLVARLLTKQGSDDLAIRHLEQAYAVTSSEETREQIRRRLLFLHRSRSFMRTMEEKRQFEERLKEGYVYAPEAFSVVAGPRRADALMMPGAPQTPAAAGPAPSPPR